MITSIEIKEKIFQDFNFEGDKEITGLSKLNIFIGPNNSGKSRLLRNLFAIKDLSFKNSDFEIEKLNNVSTETKKNLERLIVDNNIRRVYDIIKNMSFQTTIDMSVIKKLSANITEIIGIKAKIEKELEEAINKNKPSSSHIHNALQIIDEFIYLFQQHIKIDQNIIHSPYYRVYLPVLRGLKPINFIDQNTIDTKANSYLRRTLNDYFDTEILQTSDISTGLHLFETIEKNLLGKNSNRRKIRKFEEFLSREFFNRAEISLIPEKDSDLLLIGIDNIERKVSDLGDGIQAIIAILFPIFMADERHHLFFIEEPELNLHPGLQRMLVKALMNSQFERHQFFITTHSNHLLEIADENKSVAIYKFERKIKSDEDGEPFEFFDIVQKRFNDISVLDCLGVRNSSVFLSNCTIWVEGITDRKYIKKYLEIYSERHSELRKYKEDFHYSFVEYSGSNITHWNFEDKDDPKNINAQKISNRIFLIADRDCNKTGAIPKAKISRHAGLIATLDKNFYLTKGKEIENSLSPRVIERIIKKLEKNDKLKFPANWDLLNNKNGELPYLYQNLGLFIETKFRNIINGTYSDKNTIKNKMNFCETAISQINSLEDLSPEAIDMCEKIFSFIKNNN